MYEEQLRSYGLFSPEQSRLRGDLMSPVGRNGMELCQGRGSWGLGTGSALGGGGHGTGCPG